MRQNLSRLSSLPDTDAAAISAAMHMHYCAALLAGSDPSGAHGLAVGGLEVLAHQFGSPPHDWTDWDQAQGWDSFMAEAGLSDEQRRALRNKLMDNTHMRLAETFATYVSQRLPDSFWQDEVRRYVWQFDSATGEDSEGHWADPVTRSQTFPGTRKQLKKALKAAYTVRSGFIHAGKRSLSVRSELMDRPRTERRVPVVRRNASRSSDPSTA